MYEQIENPKENKNRAVANFVGQKKSNAKQKFGFVDNRPQLDIRSRGETEANRGQEVSGTNTVQSVQAPVGISQLMQSDQGVVQRVAKFEHLSGEAKQDAFNFFFQWRGLLGVQRDEDGSQFVYDRPAVQVLLNQILTDVDVTANTVNRTRFLKHVGVRLVAPPPNIPVVNVVWNIPNRDKDKLNKFPKFLRDLQDGRNYNAVDGTPGFANSHHDDTRNGQYKLQADREVLGAGSRDRLCINVAVVDGIITVTVKAFLENTH